jgi:hypothetical protein
MTETSSATETRVAEAASIYTMVRVGGRTVAAQAGRKRLGNAGEWPLLALGGPYPNFRIDEVSGPLRGCA